MVPRMVGRSVGCWSPLKSFVFKNNKDDDEFDDEFEEEAESSSAAPDELLWAKDLEKHSFGEFSFAAVKANANVEDYGQVETGHGATFAGVYDGHGGHDAARYISEHLFNHLTRIIRESKTISEEVLKNAFAATEAGFFGVVQRAFGITQKIAAIGSCCLVGIIWNKTIYIANVGDSRAVIGCVNRNRIVAHQLNTEHNVKEEDIRQELKASNHDDPDIVIKKHGVWRIKGIIQVSRSIGDVYLKRPEYALDQTHPRFFLPIPISRPVLSAEPSLLTRSIQPQDRFLIFASDGLWEHLTSQEAAEIVHKYPRAGIARRLLKSAMNRVAKKYETTYETIKQIPGGDRRKLHDDITVVVIFIDHDLLQTVTSEPQLSIRTFADVVASSGFNVLQTLDASSSSQPSEGRSQ